MTGEPAQAHADREREALAGALPAYEIGHELGRGACGVVVAARHRRLGREVAVKQLSTRFGPDSDIGARFLAEARVLASLDHPHVVPIYDFVEAGGLCLLIMERLTAGTLKDRVAAAGMTPQAACAVIVAACAALEYAHRKGVLHRDIKPQNLLISEERVVKVADFGIAKVLAGSTGVATRTGLVLGTPSYIAPEQVEGDTLSPAVDVYGAGVVLYELLCGALPFPTLGDPIAELYQHVNTEPVALLERAPGLPQGLGDVTARALRRDPQQRFASAAALAEAVAEVAAAEWGAGWARGTGLALRVPGRVARIQPVPAAAPATTNGTGVLERDRERAVLHGLVDAAQRGAGAAAVIDGPAGIGKTTLLREAASLARAAGLTPLRARGGEMERDYVYGGVRQLLEREVRGLVDDPQALQGAARLALPVLGLAQPHDAVHEDVEREFALCHGLYWLFSDLAERRPLVLLVDDLHELDPPSLRFLLYLVRRVQGMPVAIVAATRAGATASDPATLAQLVAEPVVRTLRVRGLGAAGVAALVRRRFPEPSAEFVQACAEVTGGNPFLVEQLLTAAADEGIRPEPDAVDRVRELVPDAVTRAVLTRLEREPQGVVDLARAVAVLGDRVELRDAADLAGLSPFAAADCADRLADLSLLAPGLPLGFLHPLLRATVLAGMRPGARLSAHARAATVLEANGAPPAAVAAHVFELEPAGDPWVVSVLRAAAAEALERGAADIAVRQLRRAVREPPAPADRGAVLAELGQAAALTGDGATAAQALEESVELARDPVERVVRELHAFRAHFFADGRLDPDEIMGIIGRIDSATGAPGDETQTLIGEVVAAATNLPELLPELGGPLDEYETTDAQSASERMILAAMSRVACHRGASAERAARLAERALASRVLLADQGSEAVSLFTALFTLIDADRLDLAEEHLAAAVDVARRRGSLVAFAAISGYVGLAAYQRGDVARAQAEAQAAIETGALHGALYPIIAACLVRARLAANDVDGAAAIMAPLGDAELPNIVVFNHALTARAQVRFALGDLDGAVAGIREVLVRGPQAVRYSRILPWRQFAVPILLAAGEGAEAAAVAADDVAAAESWGTPAAIGASLATQALCGSAPARPPLLERAIAILQTSPARLDLAAAQLLLGETLIELGSADEARGSLAAAAQLAQTCGAGAVAARAREALEKAGAGPQRHEPAAAHALMPSERRVAELAAQGLSDRSIAEALFVTATAVENQLDRVYAKLGIGERAELAAKLAAR